MLLFGLFFIVRYLYRYLIRKFRKADGRKIFGVYSVPGKWYFVKYYAFLVLLTLRRMKYYIFGKSYFHKESELETLQPLSDHKLAFDAVFFQAVTQDGIYFCMGSERRHEAKINGLVYFVIPDYGILLSEKLPKTTLQVDAASLLSNKAYAAEGICITPITPMKLWKLSYKGKMRLLDNPDKLVDVDFQAEFSSTFPWFLFEVEIPSTVLARAIAREPWTREFFQSLKEAHQSHYEQMGYLNGKLRIGDKVIQLNEMDAFRDHSFGKKRDWSLMHRYIYHMFYLADRTKISVGVVSQPCTSSLLEMGFITHPDGRTEAIDSCDLLLYQHAENGILNKDLCFTFEANDAVYEVKVKYVHDVVHYVGNDVEAKMNERFLECEVNGVPGRGISEWHYNNVRK